MKKILIIVTLVLSLQTVQSQELNAGLTGMYPGRVEIGLQIVDTVGPKSVMYLNYGLGCTTEPYIYLGLGLDLEMYKKLALNTELFPILNMQHRERIDRGNNTVGDEFVFGTRVRVGPKYTIQLVPKLDLVLRAGVELLCPILASRNAVAQSEVHGFIGLGLLWHTL